MFEIHVRELRATFLRNHSVRNHSVRRHKGISKAAQRKAPHRHHTGPQAGDNSSRQNAQATSRGIMPRRHDRKRPQRPQTWDGPTYAVPGPRIGAQIRQSTPNRMRLSARRPLVAAEFGARGIPVRRAPQLYDQSTRARIPWHRASTHTGRAPQCARHCRGRGRLPREPFHPPWRSRPAWVAPAS